MTHIIYLPGFGDWYDPLRRLVLRRWKNDNTRVTLVPMNWTNKRETYEQKYHRIAQAIRKVEDDNVVLIGESAGGAIALYAFAKHPDTITQVITICGYNHGMADVHPIHKWRHPAFYHLMPHVDKLVQDFSADARQRITTLYSINDHVVTPEHSRVKEAREVALHTRGHFSSIARALLQRTPLQLITKS